jgi:hypothetical protein
LSQRYALIKLPKSPDKNLMIPYSTNIGEAQQDLRQAAKILQAGREKELSELKKVGGDDGN